MVRGGGSARSIAVLLVLTSLKPAQGGRSDIADAAVVWEACPCREETATTAAIFVRPICRSSACVTSSTAASSPRLSLPTVAGTPLRCLVP
ncbi:hypothetical protein PAHAL_6G074200 [Panicum hallii]|uniref:Secreted protein n=1 Tax=Panicum hallii TaxID=206008 RepID=A0A2S3I144_9POAL|nr:hypothetical protein PAHAL_6G074200 [Panicum hallii]